MAFDATTTAAVADELRERLMPSPAASDAQPGAAVADEMRERLLQGRVDKIVQPSALSVALMVRAGGANHWLLLSADPRHARICLSGERLARAFDEPSPFVMALRKYLEGARLDEVTQPGHDRILRLRFRTRGLPVSLIGEVMGKHSNIILVDDKDTTLGAVKLVSAAINRYRVILPRHPYVPPPPPTQPGTDRPKLDPLTVTPQELSMAFAGFAADSTLADVLVDVVVVVTDVDADAEVEAGELEPPMMLLSGSEIGKPDELVGAAEVVVGDTDDVVGDTDDVVGDTEDVVGDTEDVVGDTEDVVGDTDDVVGDTDGDVVDVLGHGVGDGVIGGAPDAGAAVAIPDPPPLTPTATMPATAAAAMLVQATAVVTKPRDRELLSSVMFPPESRARLPLAMYATQRRASSSSPLNCLGSWPRVAADTTR